ncbi:MAG: PD-(D/E)XK nuclease family protein [Elusimicrobia bacterium]|nr:PD-(D/E)XK nuclease family protein [Elusimicrobiota bacterium]
MELSFTRFRLYNECPWKYKLAFIDGWQAPATPASALGVCLHRALECFHRSAEADWPAMEACFERQWPQSGFPHGAEEALWRRKGLRMLESYFENEKSRRTRIIGIEKEFAYPLGPRSIRGMVDRIDEHPDGRRELIDYKTSLESEPPAAERLSANLQLRFYALGVRESLGFKPDLLSIHYLAAGESRTIPYDDSGEEELKAMILAAAERIEAGEFRPDTSFCPRCHYRRRCVFSAARED